MAWQVGKTSRNLCLVQHVQYHYGTGREPYWRNEFGAIGVHVKLRLIDQPNEVCVWDHFWISSATTFRNFSSRQGYFLAALCAHEISAFCLPEPVMRSLLVGKIVNVAVYESRKNPGAVQHVENKWGYYPVLWTPYFRANYERIMEKHGYAPNPYKVQLVRRNIEWMLQGYDGEVEHVDPVVPDAPLPDCDL